MIPLFHIIPLLQVSHTLFLKAQDRCQEPPPPNSLQSSYEVQSTRRQEKNFPGLLSSNATADSDVNEWDVVIMEMEKSTNSSLAAMQPFGAMGEWRYRAESWRVTGVFHALLQP